MQKIIFSILAIGLSWGVLAQKQMVSSNATLNGKQNVQVADYNFKVTNTPINAKDNVVYLPDNFGANGCATLDSMIFYSFQYQGYNLPVTGSGMFGGAGQEYALSSAKEIVGVYAVIGITYDGDVVTPNIELMNTSLSALATTTYSIDELSSYQELMPIQKMFSSPVNAQNFILGVYFPEYGETSTDVIIPSTRATCSSGHPIHLLYNGSWTAVSNLFDGFNAHLFVFPIITSSAGLTENDLNQLTYIYPNPANEQIMIASSVKMDKVEIYNIVGQKVYDQNVNGNSISVNTAEFATGQYVVKMYTESGVSIKKMMVK